MGVWSRYEDIDVQRCPARRVGVQGTQIIYDHGPEKLAPSEQSRAAMRRYYEEYDDWFRGTGGKPYRVALNSVDAQECLRHRRYSRSPTEREPMQVQPQTTGQTINLVAASGGGAAFAGFWLLDLISGNKYVVFSCDRTEWLANGRGQFVETTPAA
jgi:hypothetical protein